MKNEPGPFYLRKLNETCPSYRTHRGLTQACKQQYVNSQSCSYSVSSAHRRMRLRAAVRRARWRQKRLSSRAPAERSAGIAAHRIASVPSAHTEPHWGSYRYRGAARNTRNTVRKIHSRGFIVTALQVKLLSINLCFYRDLKPLHVSNSRILM